MNGLDELIDAIADRVAARVEQRLRGGTPGMLDQTQSPLGRRRHCASVKRRLARGEPGASIVGRRHLLSPEALHEELGRISKREVGSGSGAAAPGTGVRAELERELRLWHGGKTANG